jgi:hypothetical protein
MNRHKKPGGLIKQLFLIFGLAIALLFFALFSSGILFTGAVAHSTKSAIKGNVHQ